LWMAPEVLNGKPYGTKADVWSFGCTVVEMLSGGKAPWAENLNNIVTAAHCITNSVGLPTNAPTDVSPKCRDFLERCFERDPARRASAAELLAHPWLALDGDRVPPATLEASPVGAPSTTVLSVAQPPPSATSAPPPLVPTPASTVDTAVIAAGRV